MKCELLCLPCTVRTAFDIAAKATEDEKLQEKIIFETMRWLTETPNVLDTSPTCLHTQVQRIAQRITGNLDPFKELKKASNEIALRVIPELEKGYAEKPFEEGFRFAALGTICGNTIDFEVEGHTFSMRELESSLRSCLNSDLAIDDVEKLFAALSRSKKVLYLLDNAGEIAFDKFFIKVITDNFPVKVFAAVKSEPILNDATAEDAAAVKLEEVAEVISTGNAVIGLSLDESSEEFLEHLETADLIIAKGQGNYESMTEFERLLPKPIVYVFRAKCGLVAKSVGAPLQGNIVRMID